MMIRSLPTDQQELALVRPLYRSCSPCLLTCRYHRHRRHHDDLDDDPDDRADKNMIQYDWSTSLSSSSLICIVYMDHDQDDHHGDHDYHRVHPADDIDNYRYLLHCYTS